MLFTKYTRVVLPLDGFVFWVKSTLVNPSALYNAMVFSQAGAAFAASQTSYQSPEDGVINVPGSFHYATDKQQREDESISINTCIFTAESEVNDLNEIAPGTMYIGEHEGIRFAFSSRGNFYDPANIEHYKGFAIYPALESQIIDDPVGFDRKSLVVSNSLPAWLMFAGLVPLYPSFAVPDNIPPPYAAVHIPPEATEALQAVPLIDNTGSHWQLARDRVRLTLYGLRNDQAMDFYDAVMASMADDSSPIGLMSMPVVRDEKRTQVELGILAMEKTIEFEVSYYQARMRDIARQLILTCVPSYNLP